MALRVTHCPVNLAGVGWTNVQALRSRGVDARLVVFNTQPFRPDQADWDLKRPRSGLLRQQAVQWRALAKLLPKTDIFHFYFGLTLVPKKLQFPILKATRRKSLFHFLGADIRERPEGASCMYGLKADARVVGSFAALNFIPFDAEVLPPGIDLSAYDPVPPVERERVRIVHAPSNLEKKGTEYVIEACKELPVDLDVVHGVRNEEALERYKQADIVVDQVLRDWHGIFSIEGMALGKPVVTSLDEDAVPPDRGGVRREGADRAHDEGRPRGEAPAARGVVRGAQAARRRRARVRRRGARRGADDRPPARHLRSALRVALVQQIKRLGKHSVIYGLGGLIQRIVAVLLLPLYTRYLNPSDYGAIEALVALSAVIFALLRAGIQSSFFRFYFDAEDDRRRLTVVRTSFWFTMGAATTALVAGARLRGADRPGSSTGRTST